ncbi:MAG: hypothetical protein ACI8RZ_005423, partial [Myxococcota bacterium]
GTIQPSSSRREDSRFVKPDGGTGNYESVESDPRNGRQCSGADALP